MFYPWVPLRKSMVLLTMAMPMALAMASDADAFAALALAKAKRERESIKQPVVPAVTAQVIPPGFHAHRKTDGMVIVHGDENYGSAAAHAGIERPWPKIAVAGQVVQSANVVPQAVSNSTCPGGNCPQQSQSDYRPGLFGRIFNR